MMTILKQWMVRGIVAAGIGVASIACSSTEAKADGYSSSFSYYNPRTGMQYSQGYSNYGHRQSSYLYYGPSQGYRPGGYGYAYPSQPRYSSGYNHYHYGNYPSYNRPSHCR